MKNTLLLILLLPMAVTAQKSYTISGNIAGLKEPAKVYLATEQGDAWKDTDSAEVKNGKFRFQGSVPEPKQAIIRVKRINSPELGYRPDELWIFIENSKITVTATDSIKNASVSGCVAELENREREALNEPVTAKIIKLQDEFGNKTADGAYVKSLEERKKAQDSIQKLVAVNKGIYLKFAETHLNSFMGLHTFNVYVLDAYFDPAKAEPFFYQFPSELRSTELGKRTLEKIEAAKRRQVGIKAADFTQNDINGKPFTLSSLKGKYVLIDFWASWCAPCRAENPNLIKAYAKLKDKNFEVVGVSLDFPGAGGKAAWAGAVEKDGLPWIHVSDLKGWKNEVALMYGIASVPQNLLIDPQGVIIAKNLRGEDLTEKLSALIK